MAIKQSGRNVVSRLLHARIHKEKITTWKLNLNRALHVFNVRSVVSTRLPSPTNRFQTELAINTHNIVPDIPMLKSWERAEGRYQPVSGICALSVAE